MMRRRRPNLGGLVSAAGGGGDGKSDEGYGERSPMDEVIFLGGGEYAEKAVLADDDDIGAFFGDRCYGWDEMRWDGLVVFG